MSVEELETSVRAVPGILVADVEARPEAGPMVLVRLDGSRDADEVAADVRLVLGEYGYATRESILHDPAAVEGESESTPGEPPPEASQLAFVATEETADGVVVRAADSRGRAATSPMGEDAGLHPAVTAAVGGLFGESSPPRLIGFDTHEIGGVGVLTCVIESAGGGVGTGSAAVTPSLPFTLGKAVWAALESLR